MAAKELDRAATALEAAIGSGLLPIQDPAILPAPPKVDKEEWLNPKTAGWAAGVHFTTIKSFAEDKVRYPGLGKKVGGRWRISSKVLDLVIAGELPLPSKNTKGC